VVEKKRARVCPALCLCAVPIIENITNLANPGNQTLANLKTEAHMFKVTMTMKEK
jgi:hypothetical protein